MKSDDIATALHLLSRLGLSVEDLSVSMAPSTEVPTFTSYLTQLRESLPPVTVKNYESYWRVVEKYWGERRLDDVAPTEIDRLVNQHRANAVVRSNSRDGRGAATSLISALRCIYRYAERDALIHPADNPASKIPRPQQLPSPRHALSRTQVMELAEVASTTGNDPELDALIFRLHLETACRRGGSLALDTGNLNDTDCLVQLHEKGGTVRWQPISPSLTNHLLHHIKSRGGTDTTTKLLRYRNGRPMGRRRFDYLSERLRDYLPWANTIQFSIHWLRHTTLTWVEREYSYAVARAYAGHGQRAVTSTEATFTYVRAGLPEVAHALSTLTGEPHPMAEAARHPLAAKLADFPRPPDGRV